MQKTLLFLFFIGMAATLIGRDQQQPKKAVTVVPVADLLLRRMTTIFPGKNPKTHYQNISLEGAKKSAKTCPRVHQLIFNEQVEIIRSAGNELLVTTPNSFYNTEFGKKNQYWTHKQNVIPLETFEKKGLNTQFFPRPIRFSNKKIDLANKNVVTLLFPFKDRVHHRIFSAGTRFIRAQTNSNGSTVKVWTFNPSTVKFDILSIPKHLCNTAAPKTDKQKRKKFVKLLRRWILLADGFIPYVWGGCSFTIPYKKNMITSKQVTIKTNETIPVFWGKKNKIATGFDCAGVIARAAQACNIPYFFKNSSTAHQELKPIVSYKQLQEGDLLYIKGHLMIVSDIKNNKLIEARSHWHGYGKLQEINLSEEFQGIKTYQQLFAASLAGKILNRLDSTGSVAEKIFSVKLLKLPV